MTSEQIKIAADTGWVLLTGFLVFFMNAGFGLIEAGLCQRKNATMILSKNFVVFAIATLGFYVLGFGLMFSDGGLLGTAGGWLLCLVNNRPSRDAGRSTSPSASGPSSTRQPEPAGWNCASTRGMP